MKKTNQPTVIDKFDTLNFATFLEEGLPFVDLWTPTEINCGGCGVFADLFTNELDKYNIPYKIIAIFRKDSKDTPKEIKSLTTFLETNKTSKALGVEHIVVCVKDSLYLDSTGNVNIQVLNYSETYPLSKEQLKTLIDQKGIWNDIFDKGCIPDIQSKLDEMFSHIEDFHPGMFKYPGKHEVELTKSTLKERKKQFSLSNMFNSIRG